MKTTLTDELIKFARKDKIRAHMPGHNGGVGLGSKFRRNAFALDFTEFDETDNLQDPVGVISESEKFAAEVFGASQTFYLVNGSTIGLEAAILSTVKQGDKLIVDRTCHKSVVSAMILAGAEPVFVEPEYSQELGVYVAMSPITIMDALHDNPDAVGVILTSPTYYGVCSDIERLARNIHSAGKFLIVDEAHGAHFVFNKRFPKTALEQGADIVVQSLHKTLPSLGQTAVLHIGNTARIDIGRVQRNINLLQTSSPSYMFMAGMDDAIRRMNGTLKKKTDKVIDKVLEIKSKIGVMAQLSCLTGSKTETEYDILKLVIDFSKLGISGYGGAELLKADYGIYPEAADEKNVLFYITAGTTLKDLDAIDRAITDMSMAVYQTQDLGEPKALPVIDLKSNMRECFFGESEVVDIDHAFGRTGAEILVCCPPCCPIVVPGQFISGETVDYIKMYTDIKEVCVVV